MNNDDEPKEKKKRGRKPKKNEETTEGGEQRVRKRGRKPKYKIESISEIRAKYEDTDKVEFSNAKDSNTPENNDYNKTQVSFGNLNITVTEKPEIDKEELRNMFKSTETKQDTPPNTPPPQTKKEVFTFSDLTSSIL